MTLRPKHMLLAAVLLATLAAAWFAPEDEAPAGPAQQVRQPAPVRGVALVDVLALRRRLPADPADADGEGLFTATRWDSAVAVAEAGAPANRPVAAPETAAPPLPFKVMGSYQQAGRFIVFLQQNERNHVVQAGDTIDDTYKVESVDGTSMHLRYLPLDQVQQLDLGHTLQEVTEK